jgi:3-hydroxyisobutyrate dehydrogenase-like beta-hydroxyacid dehydrogenase
LLLHKSGVDARAGLEFLTSTLFAAPVYKTYAGLMLERQYEPGFSLALGLKDVGLALDAGASVSVPMPVASVVRDRLLSGIARGHQALDLSALSLISAEDSGRSV